MGPDPVTALPDLNGRTEEFRNQIAAAGVQRVQRSAIHDVERDLRVHRREQLGEQQREHREVHGGRR